MTMTEQEFDINITAADGFGDRELSTILSAMKCGLMRPETGAQFDAYFMLADLNEKIRSGKPQ